VEAVCQGRRFVSAGLAGHTPAGLEGDDFLKKEQLETLLKKWPEVSQP
jgi:hypothetical protein